MTNKPATQSHDSAPRRISVAWPAFTERLAPVLAMLAEDQFLVISVKGSNRFVQFAAQGSFGMRAETTSNSYLAESEQLDAGQIAALIQAGWSAPTGGPKASTPELDPDGSPNFFIEFPDPVPFGDVAKLSVHTLAEVLRVPHPGFLEYEVGNVDGTPLELPALGLKRAVRDAPAVDPRQLLLATMRKLTGIDDLKFDGDGDIGIRYGSVVAYLCLVGKPPHVHIFSPLVLDVEESPKLLERLNEINANLGALHVYLRDGIIFAVSDLPATPLVPEHLVGAAQAFFQIADGIDTLLQAEFGGRTTFAESMPSVLKH